jgi:Rrf2 family protein
MWYINTRIPDKGKKMDNVLRISEASSLAMHAAALLAEEPDRSLSTREIAENLKASEAHLSKVLQRLTRAGIVKPIRGPKGGYMLGKAAEDITLLDIYEEIEGPIPRTYCLMKEPVCRGKDCILGGLLKSVNKEVRDYLSRTRLSDFNGKNRKGRTRK